MAAPALTGVDHVHVLVHDRTAATAWYRRVMGLVPAIALGVDAPGFMQWREHLAGALGTAPPLVDHDLSLSLYFHDPDGNPYEVTT